MQKIRNYRIVLRKEPEGSYTALVPSLPGCITWGETVEQAIAMAKDAIEGYIAVLQEDGGLIPDDNDILEYSLQLSA